jgi:hypothetical protein
MNDLREILPDARDGLTRRERVVPYVLHKTPLRARGMLRQDCLPVPFA